ncbi:MAG: DUF3047 domain-containing protein [Gammaproteobacteria bacterium]|nr:DUF3047 domain-containing protein [Gammaproteobacteria bacterium]
MNTLRDKKILQAKSSNSASALIKEIRIDLKKYPYLNWSWSIENRLHTTNEKLKSGDDYAARVYVVVDGVVVLENKGHELCVVESCQKRGVLGQCFCGEKYDYAECQKQAG